MEFVSFVKIFDTVISMSDDPWKEKLWLVFLLSAISFAVIFAFKAVALYTIAKRNGYGHRWMAFIPFVSTYYIGVVSEKNKFYGMKAKHLSLGLSIMEFVIVSLYVLLYVAEFLLFAGKYAEPSFNVNVLLPGTTTQVLSGYTRSPRLPYSLEWAWWVFSNLEDFVLYWLNLLSIGLEVLTYMLFFQTYASRNYVMFALFSVLFPLSGIFFFVVRKNKSKNYREYVMERQRRQYRAYQDYMRNNPENPNNYNPYSGRPTPPPGGEGGESGGRGGVPEDPFDGLGSSGGSDSGDPFGEF